MGVSSCKSKQSKSKTKQIKPAREVKINPGYSKQEPANSNEGNKKQANNQVEQNKKNLHAKRKFLLTATNRNLQTTAMAVTVTKSKQSNRTKQKKPAREVKIYPGYSKQEPAKNSNDGNKKTNKKVEQSKKKPVREVKINSSYMKQTGSCKYQ